ncbi:MAG: hypothetical protein ACM3SS_11605 [Rhodospirillaceae bacterium]
MMNTLDHLIADLDAAVAAPTSALAHAVAEALAKWGSDRTLVPPQWRNAKCERYTRHLLYADPRGRYSILVLVWGPGQRSPIHAHRCWCGVAVCEGQVTEMYYRPGAAGTVPVEVTSLCRSAGDAFFDQAFSGIHRIANHTGENAISLHVYGVAGDRIETGVNQVFDDASRDIGITLQGAS